METPEIIGIVASIALTVALLVLVLHIFVKYAGCILGLASVACACVAIAKSPDNDTYWAAAATCFIVSLVASAISKRRRRTAEAEVIVEGVPLPKKKRKPRFAKVPDVTPDYIESLCLSALDGESVDRTTLRACIDRAFKGRNISNWALANGDTYFDEPSQKQIDFLAALKWSGKKPKYMGEASNFIEVALVIKDYRAKMLAESETSGREIAANYTALWNAATEAGVLARSDAAQLMQIVSASADCAERRALFDALAAVVKSDIDGQECPAELFVLSSAWLAKL